MVRTAGCTGGVDSPAMKPTPMYRGTVSGSTPIATTAVTHTASVAMSTGRMPEPAHEPAGQRPGDRLADGGGGEHEPRGAVGAGLLLDVQQERQREHSGGEPCGQLGGR